MPLTGTPQTAESGAQAIRYPCAGCGAVSATTLTVVEWGGAGIRDLCAVCRPPVPPPRPRHVQGRLI